ncbi:MAG: PhoX family protein [Bacteriovoracaceae bacterium]
MSFNRRDFVKFLGGSTALVSGTSILGALSGCATSTKSGIPLMRPSQKDDLVMNSGLKYELLLSHGDKINSTESFGFNNDYNAFIPLYGKNDEALFWTNHEYPHPMFLGTGKRTKEDIVKEQKALGGSIVHIKKDEMGRWQLVKNSKFNKRVDGTTEIPIIADRKIAGTKTAIGTFANCAGGITPWGTVLTCEENYHDYYGEIKFGSKKKKSGELGWDEYFDRSPYHYGWVVEVDLLTAKAKKLTALGRFAHESATTIKAKDGRTVVYSGDDKVGECLYKFIADKPGSLDKGELFVADVVGGKWLSLDIKKQPKLKAKFKDQTDVLIHCRDAAKVLGATPLDRPEDVEIQPGTNNVFVCLTNNKRKNNYHGSILKIEETGNDPLALTFKASDFAVGGEEAGFSCPDNIAFDGKGNLWMTTDMSGSAMNKPPYTKFKNNGLFYFPMSGPDAGVAVQMASAPTDAELTGLCFSADEKTLFLSIQHPGEKSKSLNALTSTWPFGPGRNPEPSVVQISGPLMDRLT